MDAGTIIATIAVLSVVWYFTTEIKVVRKEIKAMEKRWEERVRSSKRERSGEGVRGSANGVRGPAGVRGSANGVRGSANGVRVFTLEDIGGY